MTPKTTTDRPGFLPSGRKRISGYKTRLMVPRKLLELGALTAAMSEADAERDLQPLLVYEIRTTILYYTQL
jgi:hypothetical protein